MGGKGSGVRLGHAFGFGKPYSATVKLSHEKGRELIAHAESLDTSMTDLVRRYIFEGMSRDKATETKVIDDPKVDEFGFKPARFKDHGGLVEVVRSSSCTHGSPACEQCTWLVFAQFAFGSDDDASG